MSLADTAGRVLIGSGNLPVGVLTSFMGAPLFFISADTGGTGKKNLDIDSKI